MADLRTNYLSGGPTSESDITKATSQRDDIVISTSKSKKKTTKSYVPKVSESNVSKGTSTEETSQTITPSKVNISTSPSSKEKLSSQLSKPTATIDKTNLVNQGTQERNDPVDVRKLGYYDAPPVLDVQPADIRKVDRARDAANKALDFDSQLTYQEAKLLPLAAREAAVKLGKGFVQAFNPANISEGVGAVVTSGARVISGKSTFIKEGQSAFTGISESLIAKPFETTGTITAAFLGPKIITGTKTKVLGAYETVKPYKQFKVKKIDFGVEAHKGTFEQYLAEYQGESFTRGGRKVGVRRVEAPTKELLKKNPLEFAVSVKEKLQGRKPGQIARFDTVAENIILRDTPSEFALSVAEKALGGKQTTATSVTQDISFAKKDFKVIGSGGKELTFTGQGANRMIVGGTEAAQFFAPELLKPTAGVPKGTASANLYYAGLRGSQTGVSRPIKFGSAKPGVVIKSTTPERVTAKQLSKDYVDLAQDLAGYTRPGQSQLSASTLKGIRTESEILTPVGTTTKATRQQPLIIPGRGKLEVFYGKDVPPTSTKGRIEVLDTNIDYLKGRISQAKELGKQSTEFKAISDELIPREQLNIQRIELEKSRLLKQSPEITSKIRSEIKLSEANLRTTTSQSPKATTGSVSNLARENFMEKIGSRRSSEPVYDYIGYEEIPGIASPLTTGSLKSLKTTSVKTPVKSTSSFTGERISSVSKQFTPPKSSVPTISGSSVPVNKPSRLVISTSGSKRLSSPRESSIRESSITPSPSISPSPRAPSIRAPSISISSSTSSIISSAYSPKSSIIGSPSFTSTTRSSPFPTRNKQQKKSNDFVVEIREQGVFKKVSGGYSSAQTAFKSGRRIVGEKAAASFRIRSKDTGRIVTDLELQGDQRLFRSKKEEGVFIERLGQRIKSGGELKEITYKGIRSNKRSKL